MVNSDKEKIRQLVKEGNTEQILEHIESLEDSAYDDGRDDGYSTGYDDGYSSGYDEAQEENR